MSEAEGLTFPDPASILGFLWAKASKRKLRLLGVACCRRVGKLLDHDYNTLRVAEGYADGLLTLEDLYDAWWNACEDHDEVDRLRKMQGSLFGAALGVVWTDDTNDDLLEAVRIMCSAATLLSERTSFIEIIHDLFGSLPFRTDCADLSWLTWNECVVKKLAESIYADHAFDRMPILADALEDAGCDNADILAHCRGEGPHVRGCWVVDMLTGRE